MLAGMKRLCDGAVRIKIRGRSHGGWTWPHGPQARLHPWRCQQPSIAWGIAKACADHGAELALTYQGDAFKKRVETPTGGLAVNVPAWWNSDKLLRIKGRGLPEKIGGNADLYAHVRIMLPEHGDEELEALMKKRK
jgi:hypothetical protein